MNWLDAILKPKPWYIPEANDGIYIVAPWGQRVLLNKVQGAPAEVKGYMNPTALAALNNARAEIAKKHNDDIFPRITSMYRTAEDQAKLIKRAEAGDPNVITPAPVGGSMHGYGIAFDINADDAARYKDILQKYGYEWGGNYATPDSVHFVYRDMKKDYRKKK